MIDDLDIDIDKNLYPNRAEIMAVSNYNVGS